MTARQPRPSTLQDAEFLELLAAEKAWRREALRRLRHGEAPEQMVDRVFAERRATRQKNSATPANKAVEPSFDRAGIVHETCHRMDDGSSYRHRGLFYTPAAVARRAVGQTRLGEPVTPEENSRSPAEGGPAILDPACGCGVFLVESIRALALGHPPRRPADAQALLDGLHGWDIDPGAVALARRNLQFTAWELLPDSAECDPEDLAVPHLHVGDALQEVSGRFDCILGNPPFIPEEDHRDLLRIPRSLQKWRAYLQPRMDYGQFFVHLALDHLVRDGLLLFVVSESWRRADSASRLRRRLAEKGGEVTWTTLAPLRPFRSTAPGLHPAFLRYDGASVSPPPPLHATDRSGPVLGDHFEVRQGLVAGPDVLTPKALRRLERSDPAAYADWVRGGTPRLPAGVFVLAEAEMEGLGFTAPERALLRPFYRPSDLQSSGHLPDPIRWLLYLTADTAPSLDPYPNIRRHLHRFRPFLEARRETRRGLRAWFHLHWPREVDLFEGGSDRERVFVVRQALAPCARWVDRPACVDLGCNVVRRRSAAGNLRALADYLNGPEAAAWLRRFGKTKGQVLQVDGSVLRNLPVPEEVV